MAKRLRPYVADLVFGLFAAAFFVWLAVRTPGTPQAARVSDLAFWPLGLLIAWVNLRNARRAPIDRRSQIGWLLLAGAALALWVSGNTWTLLLRLGATDSQQPRWVEGIELFQHVLALAAFFAFPNKALARDARLRFFADVGLTTVAGFVLAFDFVLRASGLTPGTAEYTTEVVRAFIDWATFVTATIAVSQKRDPETRAAFGCLLAANIAYLFANYFYSGMSVYHSGDAVDGLWFLAWVLRWAGARVAWHIYREGTWRPATSLSASSTEYRSSALSYFILAGAFVLLMTEIVNGEARSVDLMAVAAVAMASLLLFRQFAELRLNRRLFDAQVSQDARFRALVQQSSDVVLVADRAGRLTYVSPSASRVFGDGSPVAAGAALRDLVPPEDPALVDAIFARDAPPVIQTRMKTTSGEWRDLEVLWTNLTSDPAVGGIVLNCRDVTERNELERRLQHAQKIDAVGHLAGGLAHDFNNLLMVIRGYAELLRGQLPPDAEAQADLAHMEHAVDRASTVTRKLLAFSRRQAVQPTVIDLNAVLTDLQPIFRQLLADGVEVRMQPAAGLWRVKADQGQVEQVVVNLMTNARDAMPRGGRLTVTTSNRRVERRDAPGGPEPGDYVQLEVADSGVGMSDTVRLRIFEPFFSTKPKDRGVGLGLAMVHGIVSRAGGHIRVKSAPGQGATFTVLLPRTTEATGHAAERAAAPEPAADARTVLLVDDEPAVRDITKRLLERAGFRVIEAADGHEALAIAGRDDVKLDLLLTDMIMPGLDGREVAARFREARPGVPVVGITGYAGDADQDAVLETAGLAGLVTKPFSADALVRAVASACER